MFVATLSGFRQLNLAYAAILNSERRSRASDNRENSAATKMQDLRGLNLFSGLKPATMKQVLRIVNTERYASGDFLFRPGDPPDCLYLLQQGRVKTYALSQEGKEKILHIFLPGDAFGGLLLGVAHEEVPWALALDDVVVNTMDEAEFKRLMQAFPDLCMGIYRYMAAHHAADMRRLDSFLHTDASRRLVMTLLEFGERLGYGESESFEIDPDLTQKDLANMIGVVRSTASTLVGQLQEAGVLGGQGRRLVIHRREAEQFLADKRK